MQVGKKMNYPPHDLLLRMFTYNPETGECFRPVREGTRGRRCGGFRIGTVSVRGYVVIRIGNILYPAHRLAWQYMTGKPPEGDIDHINLDRADNRWVNLREATRSQNMGNTRVHANSTSGLKGACLTHGKWAAKISHKGVRRHLGTFDTPQEAHAAYVKAATEILGDFARAE